jgi:hypothetical protein
LIGKLFGDQAWRNPFFKLVILFMLFILFDSF